MRTEKQLKNDVKNASDEILKILAKYNVDVDANSWNGAFVEGSELNITKNDTSTTYEVIHNVKYSLECNEFF